MFYVVDPGPAQNALVITPSDSTNITPTRGLYIGGAGNVSVTMAGGQVITFLNVVGGTIFPLQVTRVMATNTTATNIIAMW